MAENRGLEARGMTCVGCENRTTGGFVGVESASADHEVGRVQGNVDRSEAEIPRVIEEPGYRVVI